MVGRNALTDILDPTLWTRDLVARANPMTAAEAASSQARAYLELDRMAGVHSAFAASQAGGHLALDRTAGVHSAFAASQVAVDRIRMLEELVNPRWQRVIGEFERGRADWERLFKPSEIDRAFSAANAISKLTAPSGFDRFISDQDTLACRIASIQGASWWEQDRHLGAFANAAAMSNALRAVGGVDFELHKAAAAFLVEPIPVLPTLADHRLFLDAAGLWLPRRPLVRRLSHHEKRQRLQAKLKSSAPEQHVLKAHSVTHQYELVLRDVIEDVMEEAFGEDWHERLQNCGCSGLLGKWRARGGSVLDHADFADYIRIMTHEEHYLAGFNVGYPDIEALKELLSQARKLRAHSHHPRPGQFRPQDLRTLRLVWRQLANGFLILSPNEEFDFRLG
jgi:hypothetical protein